MNVGVMKDYGGAGEKKNEVKGMGSEGVSLKDR
jgi:hypothetical protein